MLYYSDRLFRIWAYIVSHSSLLLRSEMKFEDDKKGPSATDYNIDIEISAVSYINLPERLLGLEINYIPPELLPINIDAQLLEYNRKIFELRSQGKSYYIVASGGLIGINQWINEDRISGLHLNLKHDEVILTI